MIGFIVGLAMWFEGELNNRDDHQRATTIAEMIFFATPNARYGSAIDSIGGYTPFSSSHGLFQLVLISFREPRTPRCQTIATAMNGLV